MNPIVIALGSSFTAEPLRLPLQHWLSFLGQTAEISVVPYGQMMLHLLDANSPWNLNEKGFNVVLLRPSDFARNSSDSHLLKDRVEEFCSEFESASRRWRAKTLLILVSPEPDSCDSECWPTLLNSLQQRFQLAPRIKVVTDSKIFDDYSCYNPHDAFTEQAAHIPWNDAAWLAIASHIARFIDGETRPPVKAIVVDCDNTLWHGVCAEDGPQGVQVQIKHQILQQFLLQQRAAGKLICLCSKNSPEDVWSVFQSNPEMLLQADHITGAMINWSAKSANLLQLSKELNIAPDSFLFLDDNPLEVSEVRANLPEVISICLPDGLRPEWNTFLQNLWLFDESVRTSEDTQRSQMYRDELERASLRAASHSVPEFLRSLNVEIDIKSLEPADQSRADQLLQRTNQFNIRPSKRSLTQLQTLELEHELEILTVRTRDRFGDYGLVGLLVFHCEGNTLHLDHLVLSCRALGRTVEIRMLQHLAHLAEQRLKQEIEVKFEATTRNQPAYSFLCELATQPAAAAPQSTLFSLEVEKLLAIDPIEFASQQKKADDAVASTTVIHEIASRSLRYQTIAELDSVEAIEKLQRSHFSKPVERSDSVEYPNSALAKQICEICEEVLLYRDLAVSDSFRDLGCNSLQFVRICSKINIRCGVSLAIAETFALGTIHDLVQLVERQQRSHSAPLSLALDHLKDQPKECELNSQVANIVPDRNGHEIAIIGMAGRFPGADDVRSFWENLLQGIESIETLSEEELNLASDSPLRTNPNLVRRSSYIKNADQFDARFFGVFPKEAAAMDPQHRLLLEECYHALEDAGYIPDQIQDSVGVFAGCYMDTYVLSCLETHPEWIEGLANSFHGGDLLTELGNDKDYLATRISFLLNLRGPALTIQTACSTSLVAIIQACQSLHSEQCRMALAGGVTLKFPQKRGYLYTEGGMVSPEGKCRTFDANAKGTIFGEGVAVVVLKKLEHALEDGDPIYAVLKGWGLNNDGRSKAGYTAPSIAGQAEAITLAHQHSRVSADTIQYVEAHGTGTALGDPIEIEALTRAFRKTTNATQFCHIGSAKTNIGHLDVAAGACGLIKASLALRHETIPPTLNFENPNPNIDFANSPFKVITERTVWPRGQKPRRAGLSSFGVGGTNAHVVIEEAPSRTQFPSTRQRHLLTISARSETALLTSKQQLLNWLQNNTETSIADVCFTLSAGRKKFNHSWSAVVSSTEEAIASLMTSPTPGSEIFTNRRNVPVVFAFPGQGSQHVDMGYELYINEPTFASAFDRCTELLQPLLNFSLREALFSRYQSTSHTSLPDVNQTIVAQPGIFAIAYSTAQWLMSLGITPAAMLGHSVGEFVAACLSGVFSLEDALRIVAFRARSMQNVEPGHMLAVRLAEERLLNSATYIKYASQVSIAAVNSPNLVVLSGRIEVVEALQKELEGEGIVSKILITSHAFHSWMMDPVVDPLIEQIRQIRLHKPNMKIVSSVTGKWLSDEEATSAEYWAKHLRETVRFSAAAETILAGDYPLLVEIGPGQTVATLIKQHKEAANKTVLSVFPHVQQTVNSGQHALQTLGKIWQAGAEVQLSRLYSTEKRARVNLPGYPFERQRFWFDQLVTIPQSHNGTNDSDSKQKQVATPDEAGPQPNTIAQKSSENAQLNQYARNDEYSAIVQQVIQQQLEIMTRQLKLWSP